MIKSALRLFSIVILAMILPVYGGLFAQSFALEGGGGHIIEDDGVAVTPTSSTLNFTTNISCSDVGGKTTCSAMGSSGGHTIEQDGEAVTVRDTLNFVNNITCSDIGGKTTCDSAMGGGTGAGLSLSRSIAMYGFDQEDETFNYNDMFGKFINLAAGWELSSTTVGWTGDITGPNRGKLVRDSGTATTEAFVIVSMCAFDELSNNTNDHYNISIFLNDALANTFGESSGSLLGSQRVTCLSTMYLGPIAADDEITLVIKGWAGESGEMEVTNVQIIAWAPSYTPPDIDAESGSPTLTVDQVSGGIITNRGATAPVTYTLPAAVSGMSVTIINEAAFAIEVVPNVADQIMNLTNAQGDSLTSDGFVTSALTLISSADTEWWGLPVGSWPDTN